MSTPKEQADRALRLRWLALMLHLSRDVSAYASEFQTVLELPRQSPNRQVTRRTG